MSELESVQLFQQTLPSNLTSTNWSTLSGTITFDNTQRRSFIYSFIGLQCNGSWTELKSVVNSVLTNLNTGLTACINYPAGDTVIIVDTGEYIRLDMHRARTSWVRCSRYRNVMLSN